MSGLQTRSIGRLRLFYLIEPVNRTPISLSERALIVYSVDLRPEIGDHPGDHPTDSNILRHWLIEQISRV